jgi:hypothetical protein
MKRGTTEHPKMKKFARLIKMPVFAAVGIMEMLWHWTAKFAPAGDIGRFDDADIAEAVAWPSDRTTDELIQAMIGSGWVERMDGESRLYIHDWHEHADDTVNMSLARDTKFFANGVMPKLSRLSNDEKRRIEDAFKALAESGQAHKCTFMCTECASKRTALALALPKPPPPLSPTGGGEEGRKVLNQGARAIAERIGVTGEGLDIAATFPSARAVQVLAEVDEVKPKSRPGLFLHKLRENRDPPKKLTAKIIVEYVKAGVVLGINGTTINGKVIQHASDGIYLNDKLFVPTDKLQETSYE